MDIEYTPGIKKYLENYLKQEGIIGSLPLSIRNTIKINRTNIIWILGQFILPICLYVILFNKSQSILPALLIPLGCQLVSTITYIFVVSLYLFIKKERTNNLQKYQTLFGFLYVVIVPLISAIILGFAYSSFNYGLIYYISSIIFFVIVASLHGSETFEKIWEFIRQLFRLIPLTIGLGMAVFPTLLLFILFSLFSSDFWALIGNLGSINLILVGLWLAGPILTINWINNYDEEIDQLTKTLPKKEKIWDILFNIPEIKENFRKGFISVEEKRFLNTQSSWKIWENIHDQVMKWLPKDFKKWLFIYLEITQLVLLLGFVVYFSVFFYYLISPQTLANWMSFPSSVLNQSKIQIIGVSVPYFYFRIVLKVSALLALFSSLASRVYIFSDASYRQKLEDWFLSRINSVYAATCAYHLLEPENYQLLRFIVNDELRCNAILLLRPNLSSIKTEEACRDFVKNYPIKVKNLIMVTAFEKIDGKIYYHLGLPGKKYRLLINKTTGVDQFEDFTFEGEILDNHELGLRLMEEEKDIPDEWFGNNSFSREFAKELWASDWNHTLIEHPFVSIEEKSVSVNIYFTRHFKASKDYRNFTKTVISRVKPKFPGMESILMGIYVRENDKQVMQLFLDWRANLFTYKDEYMKSSENIKEAEWVENQKINLQNGKE